MRITKKQLAPVPAVPARTEGWEHRHLEVLANYDAVPFEWGTRDCLTQVADVCLAMTGLDPLAPMRGYASELEAGKIMLRRGCQDVGDALAQAFPEVAPAQARRGDAGIVLSADGVKMAVVVAGSYVVGRHANGSFKVPLGRLVRAFKIGW